MINEGMFNGMFGKIAPGMCRLSMSGGIAVKTSTGYKSYDVQKNRLTNCSNFVFPDMGEEFFFVIPTNKVAVGDIILVAGSPKCVKKVEKNEITVINYENGTVDTIIPERHIMMGSSYFYGKIVCPMFGDLGKGKNGMKQIMQYKMMTEMLGGKSASGNGMGAFMALSMMNGGGMEKMFSGIFDSDDEDEVDELVESEDEE